MADEKIESPVIEAPAPKAEAAPKSGEIDYAEIVAKLEKAGITEPKQLDGKLQAAQERGHLANLLGQRNQELADMKAMMAEMQAALKKQNTREDDGERGAGAIDLGDLLERKIDSAFEKRQRAALEMQQRAYQAWQAIQTDEDYHLVQNDWEAKLRDPNFAIGVQSGTVDVIREYQQMVRNHYKTAIRSAATIIKNLTQGSLPPQVHVEDSARVSAQREPTGNDERQKTISTLRDSVNKGKILTEEDELAALTAVLSGAKPPSRR